MMVGITGAIGALLRYLFGALIPSTYFMGFPVSTLGINLSGSFGLSWFFTWVTKHPSFPDWARTAIATGFIGSFTTFSTFNIELIHLVEKNHLLYSILYFICSTIGGYLFSRLGYEIAKNKD
ncbi:fluoride efflux transporter CrcB [Shimazuella sp. AN120528]|nr:fluoride efflux transporter CrcB [Shimazuella soli]